MKQKRNRKCHVPLEDLRDMLDYHVETGQLRWTRSRTVHPKQRGKPVSSVNQDGYLTITLDGHRYAAHRIAWLLYYGNPPRGQLTHRNGDRLDNRINNLKEVNSKLEPTLSTVLFGEHTPPRPERPPWE